MSKEWFLKQKNIPHKNYKNACLYNSPKLSLLHEEFEEPHLLEKEDRIPKSYPQPANPFWILCACQKKNQNGWKDQPSDGNLPAPTSNKYKSHCIKTSTALH